MSWHPIRILAEEHTPDVAVESLEILDSSALRLAPNGGDVWLMPTAFLQPYRNKLEAVLSPDERERRDRFLRPDDRTRFALFRGALRHVLAGYLRLGPAALHFTTGPNGKPAIAFDTATPPLEFNLSHSGDWLAIGCASAGAVGVDIEEMDRDLNPLEIAVHSFHPNEAEILARWPEAKRRVLFLQWWTAKEAVLKTWGQGLFESIGQLDFSGWIDQRAVALEAANGSRWTAWRFSHSGITGTFVASPNVQTLKMRTGLASFPSLPR